MCNASPSGVSTSGNRIRESACSLTLEQQGSSPESPNNEMMDFLTSGEQFSSSILHNLDHHSSSVVPLLADAEHQISGWISSNSRGLIQRGLGSFSSCPGLYSTLTVSSHIKDLECALESFIHLFERPLPDLFPVVEGPFLSPPFLLIYRPPVFILISEIRELARLWLSPTTIELTGVANPEFSSSRNPNVLRSPKFGGSFAV